MKIKTCVKVLVGCFYTLMFAACVAWLVGLTWFYNSIPKSLKGRYSDKVDSVVVLTGGGSRIDAGVALLKNGLSDRLFISGVGKSVTLPQLLIISGFSDEEITNISENKDSIFLGKEAINTRQNAWEVNNWIKDNNINSIYLVTANYHMPRALLEFKSAMPEKKIIPYPAFPEDFKAEAWYKDLKSAWLIALEYSKFIAVMARIHLNV